jgi:hypothetical protein
MPAPGSNVYLNPFESLRHHLSEDLATLSKTLDTPTRNRDLISKDLSDCAKDLDTLVERAKSAQENDRADVPSCLKKRCELLQEVMIALSDALRETDRMASRAVLMMGHLGSQIGRLTLHAHDSRVDIFARHCDDFSLAEMKWVRPSTTCGEAAERAFDVLGAKWALLDLAVDGCDCLQCETRRRRAGGTASVIDYTIIE